MIEVKFPQHSSCWSSLESIANTKDMAQACTHIIAARVDARSGLQNKCASINAYMTLIGHKVGRLMAGQSLLISA